MERLETSRIDIAGALRSGKPLSEDLGKREVLCQAHGQYISAGTRILITRSPKDIWSGCPKCALEKAEAERAELSRSSAEAMRQKTEDLLEQTLLPARFVGRTLGNFVVENDRQERALRISQGFAENFDACLRKGSSLIFSGLPGTGKSHLAAGILQFILPRHVGLYVTMLDLIRVLRNTWRRDSEKSESEVLSWLSRMPLLVIDEVGVQYGTDGERTLFFDVLDRRYRENMPVILLTNQGMDDFKVTVGERIYDRLTEVARWVSFDWNSYRTTARKEFRA